MKLEAHIYGDTDEDLKLALEEVMRLVSEGYTFGFNRNETGEFKFQIYKGLR